MNTKEGALQLAARLSEIRRDLHRNPELSFKEHRTGDKIVYTRLPEDPGQKGGRPDGGSRITARRPGRPGDRHQG